MVIIKKFLTVKQNASVIVTKNRKVKKGKCLVCRGEGILNWTQQPTCPFCEGSGKYSKICEKYMLEHNCKCEWDNEDSLCPVCDDQCHHNSSDMSKPDTLTFIISRFYTKPEDTK